MKTLFVIIPKHTDRTCRQKRTAEANELDEVVIEIQPSGLVQAPLVVLQKAKDERQGFY